MSRRSDLLPAAVYLPIAIAAAEDGIPLRPFVDVDRQVNDTGRHVDRALDELQAELHAEWCRPIPGGVR